MEGIQRGTEKGKKREEERDREGKEAREGEVR